MSKKEELLAKLAKLSPEKRAFLEKQLMTKAATGIPRRAADEPSVLSFAQQRLWFLEQFEPGLPTYNMQFFATLDGPLRTDVLDSCLMEIIERHEVLRTTYRTVDGEARQEVQPSMPLQLAVTDLRSLPFDERVDTCNREVKQEAARPFDLEKGPLLRAAIWQMEEQQYNLLVSMHHIAGDGWSAGVLIRELAALYKAFSQDLPSPLPPLDIQYADFAVWQRKYLQDGVLAKQLEYWKRQLSGELPILNLPHDKPRPSKPSYRGATEPVRIEGDLIERLKQLSQEEGSTLFMTLLAAYNVLLYRYTGQDDLLVGMPIANRQQAEIQPLVGFFVNTLVLRTAMSGELTFRELVQRVRAVCLDAYANQEVPFEKLVAELESDRSTSHSVLFQTMFALNPAIDQSVEFSDLKLTSSSLDTGTSKFDMSMHLFEGAGGVKGTIDYSTDLFHASTMQRMAGHYTTLLESIAADPNQRILDIPILTEADVEQLNAWNDNLHEYPTDLCIHQLFEEQVEKTPDATALVFEEQRFTYRELNERANQVAHHLQGLGVGPEVFVGVCMERSPEMAIAMMGILKSGGAYVPLDPKYPQDRIQFMMEDAKAPVLLTQQRLAAELADSGSQVIPLDTAWDEVFAGQSADNPVSGVQARNLAYVIYTSGSTGKPKGVAIEHFSVNVFIHWVQDTFTRDEMAGVLFSTSICFDLSVYELFATLAMGGKVILVENALHLPQASAAGEVTLINTVPSAIAELLKMEAIPSNVRVVNLAGEPLKNFLVQNLYALGHVEKVYNLYGPSEDTTYSTVALMERGSEREPLIGVPIYNTQAYLLDQNLRPVPIGVTGELYLGGDGLARGYLHRQDLTDERFLPNPFTNEPGARMYKTGDLGRFMPDGQIDYQGRIDHQVKVRGFRIELGEIEAKLLKHPAAREAVVMAREDMPGDKVLVAYLSAKEGRTLGGKDLRAYLKELVPGYMVPSTFVILDTLPLTPNGKVDRKALPVPERNRDEASREYVAPRTEVEEVLAGVWADVLRLEQVGVHDNFFELGGHSLLATQVLVRIHKATGLQLPLRSLFDAPTLEELAQYLEQFGHQEQQADEQLPILPRAEQEQVLLSVEQERLWFFEQFEPGTSLYNIPAAVRLKGALDADALRCSFEEVVRRHESLRTSFANADGQPLVSVREEAVLEFERIDAQSVPEAERDAHVEAVAREAAARPFDLAHDPLLRVVLIQTSPEEHVLVFVMHHIVSDGWSISILLREMSDYYEAFRALRPIQRTELPIQYADYAAWQRDERYGAMLDEQMAFWKQQLAGELPVLQFPTDRARQAVQTYNGAAETFVIPRELAEKLKGLSQREGATLFMTLLTAFNAVLHRYTGQEDILVGTPIAGRNRAELESLIGFFVNTLVLRTDLSGDPSFRQLLNRVRHVSLDAYAHQDMPFERLVSEVLTQRDMSYSPLFQVMFILQNVPLDAALSDLQVEPLSIESGTSKFDFTLSMTEKEQGLVGHLEYNVDLFDASTMRRFIGHFRTLLENAVADPALAITEIPMLTPEDAELLGRWNDNHHDYPTDLCIHQLFEAQVEQTPDATALVFENQRFTYRELNRRANQVAHHLQGLGVGPEVFVGVCMERSPEMAIAMIGILKAGGAYVPLDPNYPQDRIQFMMEDAQAPVLLTQERLAAQFADAESKVIPIDTAWAEVFADQPDENPVSAVQARNLAYVIYTSGSTGKPKGVAIEHFSVNVFIHWARDTFTSEEMAGVLFSTSICFDLSVYELFGTLATGGKVILVENALHFPQAPAAEEVTLINTVPSAIAQLLKMNGIPSGVRVVNLAGEPLKNSIVQSLYRLPHIDKVYNLYGPSEDTTYSTVALMERDSEREPLIGVPIHNTQAYILDRNLRHVPIGVTGELYLAGDGLSRGYLHRPDLAAERYLPDPFSKEAGARMYKTGDLTRFLSNGQIEYQGRIDHQVKVRGFRIELGEIEAKLGKHPAVRETTVIVREDRPGDQRITAYLVLNTGEAIDPSAWFAYLADKLPRYMIPSAFLILPALPLTPNGKVDRKALPVPDASTQGGGEHVEPRTPTETSIAGILKQVLRIDGVGAESNFFELGGHSLLATQVITRINDAFAVQVPLKAIFEKPTVAALASLVEQLQEQQPVHASALKRMSREQPLKLSHAQQRLWVLDQLLEQQSSAYNIPGAVRLQGQLNAGALQRVLNEIVARHEVLRTRFVEVEGEPVQVISEAVEVPLHTLRTDREDHVQRIFREEAEHAFDLSSGPLVRFSLVQLADDEHVLIVNFHHIVFDGWSLTVFIEEFVALYSAYVAGQESPLAPLPIQYADYAAWQREWLEGDNLQQQLNYWQQQLAGLPVLQLPTDRPRPSVQTYQGAEEKFALSRELTDALHALSQAHHATLYMTLLAGFQTLLSRYSGQEDLAVGTPIAGRMRREVEGLIGFFVNTLVLRVDLSGDPNFVELLQRVCETALQAFAHQDVPFERLVEALQPERDTSRSPLFQVMFLLQNFAPQEVELEGLTVRQMPFAENATAKFDLTLTMEDRADGLVGTWEYNTDLFEAETIQRLTEQFRLLLEQIAAAPQEPVSKHALLTGEERQYMLLAGNQFERVFEKDECLHERFIRQVAKTPDNIALVYEEQTLTYRELNARANQLAHVLRRNGVGPETWVGLYVERSLDTVIGLLGILKAGGAYVPLDPANPAERLSYILSDSQVAALVTQSHLLNELPVPSVPVICLDTEAQQLAQESAENPDNLVTPQNLAYVIYTSGSTGLPKGVMMEHESVIRLFTATDDWYGFGEQDVWTMFHSYAFDFSVWEIWGALLYGGKLVVVPYLTSRSPEDFYRLLVQEGVTVLNQTPSAFRQLMQADQAVGQPGEHALRYIIFGGEALELQTLKPWFLRHGDQRPQLVNMYGITETTVHVTYRPITMSDLEAGRGSVIGVPIPDQQLFVLDKHLQPVPYGVMGEIYVGGAGLARGYHNRPELTAERFLPNPFTEFAGGRLYKSGDLARRLANGELEYAGRIDHQVKIRGFRIELGEIEAVLLAHDFVREAAVLVREDNPGDKRLVAYLVPETDTALDWQEVRAHAKMRLTDYMVPSAFVVLDAFPLTNNGKLDRRALPAPQSEQMRTNEYIAPRTAMEQQLADIFADVLGAAQVGITDNFFDLGGHSLSAMRLKAQIEKQFAHSLPLTTLFQAPTVEQLALWLGTADPNGHHVTLVPIQPGGTQRPLFFIHPIGGHVLSYTELARELGADQPFYGLQAPGVEDDRAPLSDVEQLAALYVQEIRHAQPEGPYRIGGWSFGGAVAYEVAQQLKGDVEQLILLDAFAPIEANAHLFGTVGDDLAEFAYDLASRYGRQLPEQAQKEFASLPTEAEQIDYLIDQFRAIEVLPLDVDREQVTRQIAVFRSHREAYRRYRPSGYDGVITLIRAEQGADPAHEWRQLAAKVDVTLLPATHFTLMTAPHVQQVAEHIQRGKNRA